MNKGFYKNYSTMSPFQFDFIYNNRAEMDRNASTDGILIGRYVFIEYNDSDPALYKHNINEDNGINYDSTIWQKVYDEEDKEEKYIQIASLDTPIPSVETKAIKPHEKPSVTINPNTQPEGYVFNLPKTWDIKIRTAEDVNYSDEYEYDNTEKRPLNIYYNKKGLKNIEFIKISKYEPDTFYYREEDHLVEIDFQNLNYYQDGLLLTNEEPTGEDISGRNMKVKNNDGEIVLTGDTYYYIKILEDNEYLWDDIKNTENLFYTLSDPSWLLKEDLENNILGDLDNYVFYYKGFEVQDYIFVNFEIGEDKASKLKKLLDDGFTVTYSEYTSINKDSNFTYSSNYYDNDYNPITVFEKQNETEPYYFKAKEDYSYFIFEKGQPVKDSNDTQTAGRDYYEDEELKNPVNLNLNTYAPKTFYRKNNSGEIQGIYEKVGEDCYYLAYEENAIDGIEYYEKVSYFEKNETLENKINLETDIIEGAKELSLILPGLGNIAADIYNLFYNDGKEEKSTTIYSSVEYNENLYDKDKEPLYNVYPQSVVGLINTIYDTIGRMKVKDLPDELNDDTVENSDLINTLFKKDNNYYLVIKYPITENDEEKWVYKAELFNEKSLYHLIAEMQHLTSGSYESIFNALDKKLHFQVDNHIEIKKLLKQGSETEFEPLSYLVEHAACFENGNEDKIKITTNFNYANKAITYTDYSIDEAGHITNIVPEPKIIYVPAAFVETQEPETAPVGSIWYDIES